MHSKRKLIKDQIDKLIQHLQPLLPLANCHMVDYFTKDIYKRNIPIKIQQEIKEIGEENVTNCILNNDYQQLPNLFEYFEKSKQFTLKFCPDICMQTEAFQDKLKELGCEEFLRMKLNIFMTSKKSHEVDILSFIAAAVKNISNTTHLIDIGDGKGYLSSMLALRHKIPVLGVDACAIKTNSAVQRVQKLSKIWKNLTTGNKSEDTNAGLYKQVTQFVDEKIDFSKLVSDVFLEKANGLGVVGLHTCGNLASSSIRIFNANHDIRTICNVGCCYNHIDEVFEEDPSISSKKGLLRNGFPMSIHLKDKKFVIGRPARMVAAQSVDRILEKKQLPNKTIFYRALFEVLLENRGSSLPGRRNVGRFRKGCSDFNDYVRQASKRLNVQLDISDGEIKKVYEDYKWRINELNNFLLDKEYVGTCYREFDSDG
ncbi:hypothetical protein NQ317_014353 [Molorchus minor]|uniref:Methyltransferase domain-containing protein n=1 Tax=Molorchus minor TaxID=1323400 RepID=A0ABQ9K774_9CUCU|nr:hypothetical protein NQ317_014353 [Molorchus minor]